MKIIGKFILLTVVAISLYNCDKDENTSSHIAGEWRLTDIHTEDGISIIFGDTSLYEFHGTAYNMVTTITENPNEFSSAGTYTYELTSPFTQTQTVSAFPGTGTWSINGDTFIQTFAGNTTESEIIELNDSTLRLKQHIDTDITGIRNIATIYQTFERN